MLDEKILNNFRHQNVLVTGGTGLIGRHVVEFLVQAGAKVKIVSTDHNRVNDKAEHVFADLRSFDTCKDVVKDMDYVFHIAGIKGSVKVTTEKPASFFVNLLMMNTNILEASRQEGVKKLVYTSSIGAYPSAEVFRETDDDPSKPPMDMFPGLAKRMAEQQVLAYKIEYGMENFSIVRPANIYGPGDNFDPTNAMVIPTLIYKVFNKIEDPISIWGDGSAIRDFLYAGDCAEGIIRAICFGTGAKFVNLGSGRGESIKYLVETLRQIVPFSFVFDPSKPGGFPRRVMDISLARASLGFDPQTSLLDGLKKTWTWYTKNSTEFKDKQNYFAENNDG